jgi:hypothetical protein
MQVPPMLDCRAIIVVFLRQKAGVPLQVFFLSPEELPYYSWWSTVHTSIFRHVLTPFYSILFLVKDIVKIPRRILHP